MVYWNSSGCGCHRLRGASQRRLRRVQRGLVGRSIGPERRGLLLTAGLRGRGMDAKRVLRQSPALLRQRLGRLLRASGEGSSVLDPRGDIKVAVLLPIKMVGTDATLFGKNRTARLPVNRRVGQACAVPPITVKIVWWDCASLSHPTPFAKPQAAGG